MLMTFDLHFISSALIKVFVIGLKHSSLD